MFNNFVIYADTAAVAGTAAKQGQVNILGMVVVYIGFIGVLYYMMIAPQKKKQKEHKKMMAEIAEGDEVFIAGGIKGEIVGISEEFFEVRVDKGVKLTVKKSSISSVYKKKSTIN